MLLVSPIPKAPGAERRKPFVSLVKGIEIPKRRPSSSSLSERFGELFARLETSELRGESILQQLGHEPKAIPFWVVFEKEERGAIERCASRERSGSVAGLLRLILAEVPSPKLAPQVVRFDDRWGLGLHGRLALRFQAV